jgi:hypothetical protein
VKTISPWFQTAELMSVIRNVLCDLEAARTDRSSNMLPSEPLTPHYRSWKDHDLIGRLHPS